MRELKRSEERRNGRIIIVTMTANALSSITFAKSQSLKNEYVLYR